MEDDILSMFLEDTREHLADIETDLLDIEEAGADFEPELVNKVFRTAHSIKGSAAFLGLNTIRDLSHKIESVLDMIRNREIVPTSAVVNVILKAFDALNELVENVQDSDHMDMSPHIAALASLVASHLSTEQQRYVDNVISLGLPGGPSLFQMSELDYMKAKRGGNFIYLVEYDLIHDVHKKNKTPLELIKFLGKSGMILDCKTDIFTVGDLSQPISNRIPFYILYASILEPDLVKAIFQVEEKYIHALDAESEPEQASGPVDEAQRLPIGGVKVTQESIEAMERAFDQALSSGADGATAPEEAASTPPESPLASEIDATSHAAPAPVVAEAEHVEVVEGVEIRGVGQKGVVVLKGMVTIERSGGVRLALLRGMELFADLEIDLSEVDAADLSLLQLLWSAYRTASKRGQAVRYGASPSATVLEAAQRAGFGSIPSDCCHLEGLET